MTPLDRLKESLRAADSLRRIEFQISVTDPPVDKLKSSVAAVRAGSLVLAVSAFEKFTTDICQHHARRLRKRVPPIRFVKLPQEIQKTSVVEGLRLAMSTKGSWTTDVFPAISQASQDVVVRQVRPLAFGRTRDSGARAIREIMKPFNLNGIFDDTQMISDFESRWGKPETRAFIADRLNEIVNRRHTQAHAFGLVSGLDISRTALERDIEFLRILGSLLASKLRGRTSEIINKSFRR